jgi:hypothetical protein
VVEGDGPRAGVCAMWRVVAETMSTAMEVEGLLVQDRADDIGMLVVIEAEECTC